MSLAAAIFMVSKSNRISVWRLWNWTLIGCSLLLLVENHFFYWGPPCRSARKVDYSQSNEAGLTPEEIAEKLGLEV